MNYSFTLTGASIPVIKDFYTEKDANIKSGTIVYIDENGVVNSEKNGDILGVCAEEHTGEKDILNERANGNAVRVNITRGGVYRMNCPVLEACANGTATTFVSAAQSADATAKGALVLVEKSDESTNTEPCGTVRKIKGVTAESSKVTFTLESGSATCAGDKYAFVPLCGFEGRANEALCGFSPVASGNNPVLKVVTSDTKTLTLEAVIDGKIFD